MNNFYYKIWDIDISKIFVSEMNESDNIEKHDIKRLINLLKKSVMDYNEKEKFVYIKKKTQLY